MRRRHRSIGLVVAVLMLTAPSAFAVESFEVAWVDQFGTPGFDAVDDLAASAEAVYAVGRVGSGSALPGQTSAGQVDTFVRAYAPGGSQLWTRQFGTADFDGFPVVDTAEGRVVIAGVTLGSFPGEQSAGGGDVFVRTLDQNGATVAAEQLGTPGFEFLLGIAADTTGSYLFGLTDDTWPGETSAGGQDFFLLRLDLEGQLVWARQFGTSSDDPAVFSLGDIALDATGIYVGSTVRGAFPGTSPLGDADALVRKYSYEGEVLWTARPGTACIDLLSGIATFDDALFLAGTTAGDMTGPEQRRCTNPPEPYNSFGAGLAVFVRRLTPGGAPVWTTQYGGDAAAAVGFTLAIKVDVDASGVYVAGEAVRPRRGGIGEEPGRPSCPVASPREDVLVQQLRLDGGLAASIRFGSTGLDVPSGLALGSGGVHVGGVTSCTVLGGTSQGGRDAFVVRLE